MRAQEVHEEAFFMHQLVYISTARRQLSHAELENILEVSRRNNRQVGVTGLLVSGGQRFLQALEGPTKSVLDIYDRIKNDPRHFACVELTSRSSDQRIFGEWSMAHQRAFSGEGTTIVHAVMRLTEGMHDLGLQAEFRTFAQMHARAA